MALTTAEATANTLLGRLSYYLPLHELERPLDLGNTNYEQDYLKDYLLEACQSVGIDKVFEEKRVMVSINEILKKPDGEKREVSDREKYHLRELKTLEALFQRPLELLRETKLDISRLIITLLTEGFEIQLVRRIVEAHAQFTSKTTTPYISLSYTIFLSELLTVCSELLVLWQLFGMLKSRSHLKLTESKDELTNNPELLEKLFRCASDLGKHTTSLTWRRSAVCIVSVLVKYIQVLPSAAIQTATCDLGDANDGSLTGWVALAYIGEKVQNGEKAEWGSAVEAACKTTVYGQGIQGLFASDAGRSPSEEWVCTVLSEVLHSYWQCVTTDGLDHYTVDGLLNLCKSLYLYTEEWTTVPQGSFIVVRYIRSLFRQLEEMRKQVEILKEQSLLEQGHSSNGGGISAKTISSLWNSALQINDTRGEEEEAAVTGETSSFTVNLESTLSELSKGVIFHDRSFVDLDALEQYFRTLYCYAFGGLLRFCDSSDVALDLLHIREEDMGKASNALLSSLIENFRYGLQTVRIENLYHSGDEIQIELFESSFLLLYKLMVLFRRHSNEINQYLNLDLKAAGMDSLTALLQADPAGLSTELRFFAYRMVLGYVNEFTGGDVIARHLLNDEVLQSAQTGDIQPFLLQMKLMNAIDESVIFPDKVLGQLTAFKEGFIDTYEGGVVFMWIIHSLRVLNWFREDQFQCVLLNPENNFGVLVQRLCSGISMLVNQLQLENIYTCKMSTSQCLQFTIFLLVEMVKQNSELLTYLGRGAIERKGFETPVPTVIGLLDMVFSIEEILPVLKIAELLALLFSELDPVMLHGDVRQTCLRTTREALAQKIVRCLKDPKQDTEIGRLRLRLLGVLIEYNKNLFYDILALKHTEEVGDLPICKVLTEILLSEKRSLFEKASSAFILRNMGATEAVSLKRVVDLYTSLTAKEGTVARLCCAGEVLDFLDAAYYHLQKQKEAHTEFPLTPNHDTKKHPPSNETMESLLKASLSYLKEFKEAYVAAYSDIESADGGEPPLPRIQSTSVVHSNAELSRKKSSTLLSLFTTRAAELYNQPRPKKSVLSEVEIVRTTYKTVYPLLLGPTYMFTNVDNAALNECASLLDTCSTYSTAVEKFIFFFDQDARPLLHGSDLFPEVVKSISLVLRSNPFLAECMTRYYYSVSLLAVSIAATYTPLQMKPDSLRTDLSTVLSLAEVNVSLLQVVTLTLRLFAPFSPDYILSHGFDLQFFALISRVLVDTADVAPNEDMLVFYKVASSVLLRFGGTSPSYLLKSIMTSLQYRLLYLTNFTPSHVAASSCTGLKHFNAATDCLLGATLSCPLSWCFLQREELIHLIVTLSEYDQSTVVDDAEVYHEANWHAMWRASLSLLRGLLRQLKECESNEASNIWINSIQQTVINSNRFLSALEGFRIQENKQDHYFLWHMEEVFLVSQIAADITTLVPRNGPVTLAIQRGFQRFHRYGLSRYILPSCTANSEKERRKMEELSVLIVAEELNFIFSNRPLTLTSLAAPPLMVFEPLYNSDGTPNTKGNAFSIERKTVTFHPYGMGLVCTLNLFRDFIKHEMLHLKSIGGFGMDSVNSSRAISVESTPIGGFVMHPKGPKPPTPLKDEQTFYKEVHRGVTNQHVENARLALSIFCITFHELTVHHTQMLFDYPTVRQDLKYVTEKLFTLLGSIDKDGLELSLSRLVSDVERLLHERMEAL